MARGQDMYVALIPAYNEEKSIGAIVSETMKHVDKVIVVDDSSSDETKQLAKDSGAVVLNHMKNQGVGAALITGIEYARRLNPEIVVILDADGQHNPTDIPRLIKPIVDGKAELVLGSRFLDESSSSMETLKKKGNKVLTSIVNMMVGKKLTDTQTGFRAFSRRALLTLDLKSKFTYTQEMVLSLCLRGYRCIEIPIHVSSRKYGKSKVVSNIISYAFKALVIIFSTYLLMWSRR